MATFLHIAQKETSLDLNNYRKSYTVEQLEAIAQADGLTLDVSQLDTVLRRITLTGNTFKVTLERRSSGKCLVRDVSCILKRTELKELI